LPLFINVLVICFVAHEEHVFGLNCVLPLEKSDALREAEMPIARRGLAANSK
jgi:hypothetical protein